MRNNSEKSDKGGKTNKQRRYTKLPFCFFPFRAPPPSILKPRRIQCWLRIKETFGWQRDSWSNTHGIQTMPSSLVIKYVMLGKIFSGSKRLTISQRRFICRLSWWSGSGGLCNCLRAIRMGICMLPLIFILLIYLVLFIISTCFPLLLITASQGDRPGRKYSLSFTDTVGNRSTLEVQTVPVINWGWELSLRASKWKWKC